MFTKPLGLSCCNVGIKCIFLFLHHELHFLAQPIICLFQPPLACKTGKYIHHFSISCLPPPFSAPLRKECAIHSTWWRGREVIKISSTGSNQRGAAGSGGGDCLDHRLKPGTLLIPSPRQRRSRLHRHYPPSWLARNSTMTTRHTHPANTTHHTHPANTTRYTHPATTTHHTHPASCCHHSLSATPHTTLILLSPSFLCHIPYHTHPATPHTTLHSATASFLQPGSAGTVRVCGL